MTMVVNVPTPIPSTKVLGIKSAFVGTNVGWREGFQVVDMTMPRKRERERREEEKSREQWIF